MTALAGCDTFETDGDSVVLEVYGPNPVLRGSDLTFIGQNLDRVTAVILPVDIEIPASDFKEAGSGSFKVTVPMECEPGEVTLVYNGGSIIADSPLSYTEQFSISSVRPQDEAKTVLSAGDSVVVEGEYLNNIVKFVFANGGAVAEGTLIGSQTRHSVTFAVPAGAMTGRIYGEDGNGNQVYSENELQILQPTVSGVAPVDGVRPGDKVTISGALLDQILSVEFAGAAEAILTEAFDSQSASSITVTVPADAHDGALTLLSAAQQEIVTVQSLVMKVPGNLAFAEGNVNKAGRQIVITGSDLDLVAGVAFAGGDSGVETSFVYADGALKVTVPDAAVDGAVTLSTAAGKSVQTPALTLVKPVISAIGPASIVAGETFTVTGIDLDLVTEVTLGSEVCAFTAAEDGTSLTVSTTAVSATGKVAVSAANGYRTESASDLTVTYNSIVTVTELTPSVAPGEPVTMKGTKFNMIEAIYVAETKVTSYVSRTDTEIVFTMPEVAAGPYNLRFVLTTGEEEECALPIEVTGAASAGVTIWEGSHALGDWSNNLVLDSSNGYDWSVLEYGATLHVTYTDAQDGAQLKFADLGNGWSDMAGINGGTLVNLDPAQPEVAYQLPDATVDILKATGVALQGKWATLVKVYITY